MLVVVPPPPTHTHSLYPIPCFMTGVVVSPVSKQSKFCTVNIMVKSENVETALSERFKNITN